MQNPYAANQSPDLSLAQTPVLNGETNAPQFATPDFAVPAMRPYDLQAPGIDLVPELTPDLYTGDLLQFDRPMGLDITASTLNPLAVDPVTPDLSAYGRPDGLIMPSLELVDPSMPDLQSPELEQEVHMADRPGEMGMADGTGPNLGPDGDADDDDGPMPPYSQEYQTPGLSHRQRKMDMLYRGLKGDL